MQTISTRYDGSEEQARGLLVLLLCVLCAALRSSRERGPREHVEQCVRATRRAVRVLAGFSRHNLFVISSVPCVAVFPFDSGQWYGPLPLHPRPPLTPTPQRITPHHPHLLCVVPYTGDVRAAGAALPEGPVESHSWGGDRGGRCRRGPPPQVSPLQEYGQDGHAEVRPVETSKLFDVTLEVYRGRLTI